MYNITLISTTHKAIGNCNVDELHKIIEKIFPEVIFLEADESSYTDYERWIFSQFGVYHKRLEINAIQKYSHNHTFEYIPVLDNGLHLSGEFDTKNKIASKYSECQRLLNNYISLEKEGGFPFLNSEKSIELQEEMRKLEKQILNNNEICQKTDEGIDVYENSMMRNIYSFSKENSFNTAIFMCGAAHRKSIIKKIQEYKENELNLNWNLYGCENVL
ncbi:hypothetical protein [Viscerimonas tarda]